MSVLVSPFVALGVWAIVAFTGSLVSSFILLLMSWTSEPKTERELKTIPAVQVLETVEESNEESDAESTASSEDEASTPTAVLAQTCPEETEMHTEPEKKIPVATILPKEVMMQPETGFLLPPRMEGDPRRLTVVLDLDETLVRSCEAEEVPVQLEFAASMGLLKR